MYRQAIKLSKIKEQTNHSNLICLPLDLASFRSINGFTTAFSQLPDPCIAALINNAGIQNVGETKYTVDCFEETFGVNHLGPFALTQSLLPFMTKDARITFTASGTHDPLKKTGMPAPVYTNANLLAHPESTTETNLKIGQVHYTTSKLCNIMTVYQLQSHLAKTNINVNAFDPGMVPGTGLARNYPPLLKFISNYVFKALILFIPNVNSAEKYSQRLANLAFGDNIKTQKGNTLKAKKKLNLRWNRIIWICKKDLWDTGIELTKMDFKN